MGRKTGHFLYHGIQMVLFRKNSICEADGIKQIINE
jgi:hypothetical protein